MIVYGVLFCGQVIHTSWIKEDLLKMEGVSEDEIIEVTVPPIIDIIEWYFTKRGLLYAQDPIDAYLFLTSEIGELGDAIVHGRGEWVRNHDKEREIGPELGDILMMLYVTAKQLGADPLDEMLKKFAAKGYPDSWLVLFGSVQVVLTIWPPRPAR